MKSGGPSIRYQALLFETMSLAVSGGLPQACGPRPAPTRQGRRATHSALISSLAVVSEALGGR